MNSPRHPFANAILAGLVLASLSACGKEPIRPAMIQPIRDPARLDNAIVLLQSGKLTKAEKTLKAQIKKDPTDRDAAMLLRSISEDPRALLGSESFQYPVKADDSYMSLAQRYLGDRYKFYALMRYNGQAGVASLAPGALLRIPGTKPREAAAPQTAPEVRQKRSAGTSKAPTPVKPLKAATSDPVRAARLRASGLSALNRGQIAQAITALKAAAAAAPEDALIKRDLARAERLQKTVKSKG